MIENNVFCEKTDLLNPFNYKGIQYNNVYSFVFAMQFDSEIIRKNISVMKLNSIFDFVLNNKDYKNSESIFYKSLVYANRIKFYNTDFSKALIKSNSFNSSYSDSILKIIKSELKNNEDILSPIRIAFFKENDIKTTVINRHTHNSPIQNYIGRGTFFGNPNTQLDKEMEVDRSESIRMYEYDFNNKIKYDYAYKLNVLLLKGSVLCCSCKPQPCHGDVISNYLNNINNYSEELKRIKEHINK